MVTLLTRPGPPGLPRPRGRPPLHGHGRRQLPEDTAPRRKQTSKERDREQARREFVRDYGFDPRYERHADAPKTRRECQGHEGGCAACACRQHLALNVFTHIEGKPPLVEYTFGSDDPTAWPTECCTLDIVDSYDYPGGGTGVMVFHEIARRLQVSRQRVEQTYASAALKILKAVTESVDDPEEQQRRGIMLLEWLEGDKRRLPARPNPVRRAQVLGRRAADEEGEDDQPATPRLSPAEAAKRRQELTRVEAQIRERQVEEARARGRASLAREERAPTGERQEEARQLAPVRRTTVLFL